MLCALEAPAHWAQLMLLRLVVVAVNLARAVERARVLPDGAMLAFLRPCYYKIVQDDCSRKASIHRTFHISFCETTVQKSHIHTYATLAAKTRQPMGIN